MEGLLSALTWAAAGLVLLLVLAFAALAAWAYCGFKPKPTPGKLKNGMEIKQLQQYETDFLDKEIFQDACYRTGIIKFKAGDTIVDAGANIGLFSLWALQECGGDARILSFEPMPTTFACLAANAEKHGAGGKIKAFNVGLSDADAQVTFDHHPFMSIWSTTDGAMDENRMARLAHDMPTAIAAGLSAEGSPLAVVPVWVWRALVSIFLVRAGETEKVPATLKKLGDILDTESISHIDLLKVDVEGAELQVLQGLRPEQWAGIQQVTLEVEDFATVRTLRALLQKQGFNVAWRATELEQVVEALNKSGQSATEVNSQVSHMFATRAALPAWLKLDEEGRMLQSEVREEAASPVPAASPKAASASPRRRRRED